MKSINLSLPLGLALLLSAQACLADSMPSRCGYSASVEETPARYEPCVFSQRQGHISITVGEAPAHQFSPDGDTPGLFRDAGGNRVYRKKGLGKRGQLFQLPDRALYVLWDPAPSRLECAAAELTAPAGCLLGDGNVGFRVQATSGSSLNSLTLQPIGLSIDNSAQSVEIDGSAYLAELADLDGDGWPEVYVYVSSAGSGSYGSLAALAVNNGKSATPIYLPEIPEEASQGYMGHDEFRVVENRLVRRFPIYGEGDTNASPGGGTRQLQYRLGKGEAGWLLELDRTVEY